MAKKKPTAGDRKVAARTYNRDAKGRFTGGGSSGGRGPAKVGRSGPRGGKVGTRAEQRRNAREQAARTAQFQGKAQPTAAKAAYKSAASAARAARRGGAMTTTGNAVRVNTTPAAGKKPRIADTLRETLRELAQQDARFIRGIEQITGQPIKAPSARSAPRVNGSGGSSGSSGRSGSVAGALRGTLRQLAQADAARLRGIAEITGPSSAGAISGSRSGGRRRVSGSSGGKALPSGKPKPKRKPKP